MERRGWIYYRKSNLERRGRSSGSSGGGAMGGVLRTFHEIVEPEIRYVLEDQDQRRAADADEQGAPPGKPPSPPLPPTLPE